MKKKVKTFSVIAVLFLTLTACSSTTNMPVPTVTNTPEPTATSTPKPTVTNTPKPTVTSTPVPTATNTSVPTVEVTTGSAVISFGMSGSELEQELGKASDIIPAEYESCEWYIYNSDYTEFTMVLVKDSRVVGIFVDGIGFSYGDINTSTTIDDLVKAGFKKSKEEKYSKKENTIFMTAYIDTLQDNTVEGFLIIEKLTTKVNQEVRTGFEKVSFELSNSFRVKNGITEFVWSDEAANVARLHSEDMKKNNYFNHVSPSGAGPGERLEAADMMWRAYAENIAMGYSNAIDVTYGWINSSGHRSNLLFDAVDYLGVGIKEDYYTQLFYTPR